MSSTIEFRHRAFCIYQPEAIKLAAQALIGGEPPLYFDDTPVYLTLVERGCSNTIDEKGRIARHVDFGFVGRQYDILKGACLVAGTSVLGGMTRFQNRRDLLPEGYIARYRGILREAGNTRRLADLLKVVTLSQPGHKDLPATRHPLWKIAMEQGRITEGQRFGAECLHFQLAPEDQGLAELAMLALHARDRFEQASWTARGAGLDGRLDSLMN